MKVCRECGQEIKDDTKICPNCGCPVENSESVNSNIKPQASLKSENRADKWKKVLLIGTCIFAITAVIFFCRGNYVKNEYYNSENYPSLNRNAYVGGDAYNYIINGTYFTGYSVIGVGCMICAVIMGTSFITIKIKECEE